MASLELYIGLPGSGKTTAAKEWIAEDPLNRRRLNYDELRLKMFGPSWKWNGREEGLMQDEAKRLVKEWLSLDCDVIIDNTNLTQGSRDRWKDVATKAGVPYYEQDFALPVAKCVARDQLREGKARVGRAVIERMALINGWIDFTDHDIYDQETPILLVDMDGTLADCSKRQWYINGFECLKCDVLSNTDDHCGKCGARLTPKKNWKAFFTNCLSDPPHSDIINLVEHLSVTHYIIVVSGRPIDSCGLETEEWLNRHLDCDVTHLFMRQGGDFRPDVEIKQEILDFLPKNRIHYVLDDRDGVVAMWRYNGLRCLQVAAGAF